MGLALLGVAAFAVLQLSAITDDFSKLYSLQSASHDITRALRRAETYHGALYALLRESSAEGSARRVAVAGKNRDEISLYVRAAAQQDAEHGAELRGML